MIKGYVLIGAAILALCNTGAYAASLPTDAKAEVVGRAAIAIYPQGYCSGYPLNITQPGSYLLAANITLSCSADAIDVKADHVVIDLGGYAITETGSGSGIGVNGPTHSNITVKNGSVVKMGGGGISLGENATIERVTASSNGTSSSTASFGVQINSGIVHQVHANGNLDKPSDSFTTAGTGILVPEVGGASTEVSDCEASNNSRYGIFARGNILRNIARNNGLDGIGVGGLTNHISDNVVEGNVEGIEGSGLISSNTVISNTLGGIGAADGMVLNNVVIGNGTMGQVASGEGDGIFTIGLVSIMGNTIIGNIGFGIDFLLASQGFIYGNKVLSGNNQGGPPSSSNQVHGGTQMGPNNCQGVPCP